MAKQCWMFCSQSVAMRMLCWLKYVPPAQPDYRQSDKDPCFYSGRLLVQASRIII